MERDAFINTMKSFEGITEDPPGSNITSIGREYGWTGVPWCAETVSVACQRNGFPLKEAAVIRFEQHARAGDWGMGWSSTPVVGSAVCFDWNGHGNWGDMHVGVVTSVLDNGQFRTIEGNYRDRCASVLRDMKYVRGFATFPFQDTAAPAQPVQPPAPPAETPAPPTPKAFDDWPEREKPVLRRNSRGDAVAYLQRVLIVKVGLDLGLAGVDGDFGRMTEAAVKTTQLRYLGQKEVDGVVGPKTWGVLDRLARS